VQLQLKKIVHKLQSTYIRVMKTANSWTLSLKLQFINWGPWTHETSNPVPILSVSACFRCYDYELQTTHHVIPCIIICVFITRSTRPLFHCSSLVYVRCMSSKVPFRLG